MDDCGVVGLDLSTGQEVSIIDETDVPFWRRRGWVGDRSLVCVHCYGGTEGRPRRVPLVPRGRVGGRRRAHFAHPLGQGPRGGGHRPESVWHAEGKQDLAAWARTHPGVAEARVEAFTRDGRRRSDVQVRFTNDARVALELQSGWVTDDEWIARHHDYERLGVRDVWLWHPQVGVPGIVAEHSQPGWAYAADRDRLTALVGSGAARGGLVGRRGLEVYGPQWPAPAGRRTRDLLVGLDELTLTPTGLALPDTVVRRWHDEVHAAAAAAKADVARLAQVAHEPAVDSPRGLAPRLLLRSGPGFGRDPDPAAATRAALARIDAHPPDTAPALQLHVCRAREVFLPGDDTAAHQSCRWP